MEKIFNFQVCVQQLPSNRPQLTYFLHSMGVIKSGFYFLPVLSLLSSCKKSLSALNIVTHLGCHKPGLGTG